MSAYECPECGGDLRWTVGDNCPSCGTRKMRRWGTFPVRYAGPNGQPCERLDVSVFGEPPWRSVVDHRCDWCQIVTRAEP